jgi:tRNA (adenine-N(1)-)-methyltransferase non-catalytic subunit
MSESAAVENAPASTSTEPAANTSKNAHTAKNGESSKPQISLHDSLLQRVSTIKEGDNVLLRMPSDMVKAVVASKDGCVFPLA